MKNPRRAFLFMAQGVKNINPLPWVKQFSSFTNDCTRCNSCKLACEQNIIISGDGGFPSIDFTQGECTFCYHVRPFALNLYSKIKKKRLGSKLSLFLSNALHLIK